MLLTFGFIQVKSALIFGFIQVKSVLKFGYMQKKCFNFWLYTGRKCFDFLALYRPECLVFWLYTDRMLKLLTFLLIESALTFGFIQSLINTKCLFITIFEVLCLGNIEFYLFLNTATPELHTCNKFVL